MKKTGRRGFVLKLLKNNCANKTLFWLFVLICFFSQASFAQRLEFDYTKETLSNGQLNLSYKYILVSELPDNTFVLGLLFSDYNNNKNKDVLVSLGVYHNFSQALYLYVNGTYNTSPSLLVSSAFEAEVGYSVAKPWVFVANYKRRNFLQSFLDTYSPGLDYYLPFPGWISARYYVSKASDSTMSNSSSIKLFYEPNDFARIYLGYASGNEAYKDISLATTFAFNSTTTMAGIKIELKKGLSLKLDISREIRDNGVTGLSTNYGVAYQW
ncbi:hypothetical protein A2291_01955 [candidate division WOR-1 bacterium RIFOXYB2_FULL_42_35]|nr:MAG: hypothetical protein A2291_01955 [candidate division WOR-1 bacterium RIFOXYB2_FULL_42_35]